MCFSTVASFGAGALLTGAGVAAATQVRKPGQWAFAAIPGIFAIQQFSEGFVWLSLSHNEWFPWYHSATFSFLLFAEVIWPVWIPFAMILLEKDRWRRQILFAILGLGIILSAHTLYCLVTLLVESRIVEHHIQYDPHFPTALVTLIAIAYGIVTIAPTFFSSVSRMWLIGLPIGISFFFSKILFPDFIISVWCFFAAIISGVVVLQLMRMRSVFLPHRAP